MLVSLGCLPIGQRHRYSKWHHGVSKCFADLMLPSVRRPPLRRSPLKPQRRVVCSLLSSYAEPASRSMPGCSWNPSFHIIESWFGSNSELCPRCWLQLQREHIFDGCLPKQERSSKVESMCQSYQSCIVPAWHGTGAQVGSSTRSAAEASSGFKLFNPNSFTPKHPPGDRNFEALPQDPEGCEASRSFSATGEPPPCAQGPLTHVMCFEGCELQFKGSHPRTPCFVRPSLWSCCSCSDLSLHQVAWVASLAQDASVACLVCLAMIICRLLRLQKHVFCMENAFSSSLVLDFVTRRFRSAWCKPWSPSCA